MSRKCHLQRQFARILASVVFLGSMGCRSIWREVPKPPETPKKVHVDATWQSPVSNPELIEQFKSERIQALNAISRERKASTSDISSAGDSINTQYQSSTH